eukprot:gene423-761_t
MSVHNPLELSKVSFRVNNMQKSINFYKNGLGMEVIQVLSGSDGKEEKAILGYGIKGDSSLQIEISSSTALNPVSADEGFFGIGLQLSDIETVIQNALKCGGNTILPLDDYYYSASLIPDESDLAQFPVRYGRISDPDGFAVEIIEKKRPNPLAKVMLHVLDLDESVAFYEKNFHMTQLRRRCNVLSKPRKASMVAYVGYDTEDTGPYVELIYKYATEKLNLENGFSHIELKSNKDLSTIISELTEKNNGQVSVEIGSDNKQTVSINDPSQYKVCISS